MAPSTTGSISLDHPAGVWKDGKASLFAPYRAGMIEPLALSDDAGTAILLARDLIARDLASGRDSVLFTPVRHPGPWYTPPDRPVILGLSNNGKRVLFRVGESGAPEGPAYLADVPSGKTETMALAEGELVTDGTVSGSGELAFLVTTTGRLVKVTISTGAVDTLIPPTPYASNFYGWAFGSLFHMKGTFTGSASEWKDRILIDGHSAPVLSVKPGQLDIQIPWSTASGTLSFRVLNSGPSPFEQTLPIRARAYGFALEKAEPGAPNLFGIKASNADGSGPPPAQPGPGDTFRLYMTGLGPVENQPPTGVPTPATVASPILGKLVCDFPPHTNPVETVSASLAPGMIGVYQATFRLPANAAPATLIGANCELCGPCEGRAFEYHGKCGQACVVDANHDVYLGAPPRYTPVP
jgi:uncharacterized protein (TIGR03437 family)